MNRLKTGVSAGDQGNNRCGSDDRGQALQESVIRREHDTRTNDRSAGERFLYALLSQAAGPDVGRVRSGIGADPRNMHKPPHVLPRTCPRHIGGTLNVHGRVGHPGFLDICGDGVDRRFGAGNG